MIRAEPCFRCGARASCRHREVEAVVMPQAARSRLGAGNRNSPWGKHGNPSGIAKQRILDSLKAQFRCGTEGR